MTHKSNKHEIRSFAKGSELQIRSTKDGNNKISGYALRFNSPSQDFGGFTEYIASTALNRTLKEQPDVLLLRDHKSELLLARAGVNLDLTVDSKGLHFNANLLNTTTAQDAYRDIQAGLLSGCSFGFCVPDGGDKWNETNGKIVRTLTDIDLFEISATSFPAYQSTNVDARAIRAKLANRDVDDDLDGSCNCECDACNGCTAGDEEDSRSLLASLLLRRMQG